MSRDTRSSFWTKNERNREICHFGRKTKFTILDEIWMKNGQLIAEADAIRDCPICRKGCLVPNVTYMYRWHPSVRCDTGTTMLIKSGACLCITRNMLVAQYKISADIKSTLTCRWNKSTVYEEMLTSLHRLGNQYIFVRLQIKYLSIAGLHLDEN